jgi:hypothetical protein
LIQVSRPQSIVELGSFSGVSYFSFCQSVMAEHLDCHCHAVDTWQGDEHAGYYDDAIWVDVKRFNEQHYAKFSTLHRCTFDEALHEFSDGSIDLLHIDGLHTYEAVRHDFETWLPKLSRRGVVLFHDTSEHLPGFGVWRLWDELRSLYPSFSFEHSHGLGVLAVGPEAPRPVIELCSETPDRGAIIRDRFSAIGMRWYFEALWRVTEARLRDAEARLRDVEARLHVIEMSASWRLTKALLALADRFPLGRQAKRAGRLMFVFAERHARRRS